MKIWTYEEMLSAINSMTEEERAKLLSMLLMNEAVMIITKKEQEDGE